MLFRYQPLNILNLQALIEDKLYFSSPTQFNDPLDCKPLIESNSMNQDLIKALKEIIDDQYKYNKSIAYLEHASMNSKFEDQNVNWELTKKLQSELMEHYVNGVCCFSKTYNNPLLWSHYADQYKGICVGYSTDIEPSPKYHEVIYENDRVIKTSLIIDSILRPNSESELLLEKKLLLTKTTHWAYEEEIRLLGNLGLNNSPLRIEEIYFGIRCPDSLKYSIYTSLKRQNRVIKYFDISLNNKTSKLNRTPVDIDELEYYCSIQPDEIDSIISMFS